MSTWVGPWWGHMDWDLGGCHVLHVVWAPSSQLGFPPHVPMTGGCFASHLPEQAFLSATSRAAAGRGDVSSLSQMETVSP